MINLTAKYLRKIVLKESNDYVDQSDVRCTPLHAVARRCTPLNTSKTTKKYRKYTKNPKSSRSL